MVIVMNPKATEKNISDVTNTLKSLGLGVHVSKGAHVTIIGVIGDKSILADTPLELMTGVDKIVHIMESYKLAGRTFKPESSVIRVKNVPIGGKDLAIIAGPCAVESEEQLIKTAQAVKKCGAQFLRGGAYKPRTSPYTFQGLEEDGFKMLAQAREETGLLIVSEVISANSVEIALKYIDVVQIGARNMQNFQLLREVGKAGCPVILKRGLSATIEEWINAAEYIMNEGNYNIIFCERGIRTFETYTRNTLDISAVPVIKQISHLPIIVDPSHGTGKWRLVEPMAMAAIAAGADGLMIEVHHDPKCALSDGPQSITPDNFNHLVQRISKLAPIMDRQYNIVH
ncbi:MAG: 3-deoxy-7-phosphoheptulonate synthase [Mahellales bacterium]|jgi:3-deoxy-7-phosphoheptulonate synthase